MALKVFWTDFSKKELDEIFAYYKKRAGSRIAGKLVVGIVKETRNLSHQPHMGQKEELLSDRPEGFRYLIYKNYKIVYWINTEKNRIEVVDVFDTRKNPHKIQSL